MTFQGTTKKISAGSLHSIPVDETSMRSIFKEQQQEEVSGLRPLLDIEGVSYSISSNPLLIWTSTIPGSWANRELYHGLITIKDPLTKEECFIYHRTNENFKFWSIEPMDDYATLSIHDGARIVCSKHPDIDIDNPELPFCQTLEKRLAASFPIEQTPTEDYFIRARGAFDIWHDNLNGRQGVTKVIPILYPERQKQSNEELGWIKRFEGRDGSVNESLMEFHRGWELMRSKPNSGLSRAFNSLY